MDGRLALSDVLDQLESSVNGDRISVKEIVEQLCRRSFASLLLAVMLISISPASAIPGLTATSGVIMSILVLQMIAGRQSVWLPTFLTRRRIADA